MFKDRETKEKIKRGLIIASVALGAMWFLIMLYGFISVRPREIAKAKELEQHYEFNSDNLPTSHSNILEDDRRDDPARNSSYNFAPEDNDPKIAIIITNLGLNQNSTELALTLPKEISLGFLPYTTSLKPLYEQAKDLQHELFIYLPFETKDYPADFPGHMPILKDLSNEENIKRVNAMLNVFEGYQGVYGSYKEVFTEDHIKSSLIIDELNQRDLALLLGRIGSEAQFKGEANIRTISADIILDIEPNVSSIKQNLDKLVEIAKKNKSAVAYAEGYPVTIYTLKAWLPMLKSKNIKLVPVSYLLKNDRRKEEDATDK